MDEPKSNMMKVAPVGGAIVRYPAGHPKQYQTIPVEGAMVPVAAYFTRAILRGDLRKVQKAKPETKQITSPAPAPAAPKKALKSMKKTELEALAAERGLELSGEEKKADLLAMLAAKSEG